jgi:hypothetical protein
MKLHILSGERSRSSFKVKKIMHVHLMELHILSGERSRSSFKVKGHFFFQSGAVGGIVFLTNTSLVFLSFLFGKFINDHTPTLYTPLHPHPSPIFD